MTTIKEQCAEAGISLGTYYYRINELGMSPEEALTTPKHHTQRTTYNRITHSPRVLRAMVSIVRAFPDNGTISRKELLRRFPQHHRDSIGYALSVLTNEGLVVKCGYDNGVYYKLAEMME